MEVDTGDGSMICTDHPFKNTTPSGGICAFCLQEKLGKLVTSSFPITVFPTSSSSSPSFRSDVYSNTNTTTTITTTITNNNNNHILGLSSGSGSNNIHYSNPKPNRSRIMYLLGRKNKNKNKKKEILAHLQNNIIQNNNNIVLKRSKSSYDHNHPPKRGGLWSFLYLNPNSSSTGKKTLKPSASMRTESTISSNDINIVVEENDDVVFDRKVSRSRSVGCGSRSFSGDFFERISTGFGDCALRRVESQREGKPGIHERVRCGGLFSGFMITSSSSSSTSSFSSNNNNNNNNNSNNENEDSVIGGRVTSAGVGTRQQQHLHARSKSWGWALASPTRAFKKNPNPKPNPRQKPNLAAVPSLLSVGR